MRNPFITAFREHLWKINTLAPSRILLSKDLLLLSTMIGLGRTGPSFAKTACSNGHLEAGLGTLPGEINCLIALTKLDRQLLQFQSLLHAALLTDEYFSF